MLIYLVKESYGKSIKIQIDCDDILKILAGLTNQDFKVPDTPIEITKVIAQVDKNGKMIGNPYHPEDTTDGHAITIQLDKDSLPSQWEIKQEIEMDLMKAELERKLERENHNFIAKPSVISEDELEVVDSSNQTTKTEKNIDIGTEDILQKERHKKNGGNTALRKKEKVGKKENILTERKNEIETVAIENNAVHGEKDFEVKDFNMNQKRFQLKNSVDDKNDQIRVDFSASKTVTSQKGQSDKSDQIRIDYSPAKTGMELSDEDRAKKSADNQDFKDFQRRFILVDGHEGKKISY